jgi:KDO2-lipid IV(A) lauroyltransferase
VEVHPRSIPPIEKDFFTGKLTWRSWHASGADTLLIGISAITMTNLKTIANIFAWWIYWYPFRFFVQRLPLLVSYRLVAVFAPVASYISLKNRARIDQGLSLMYGGHLSTSRRRQIIRQTFNNSLCTTAEVLWYPKLTKQMCERIMSIEGQEHLDEALRKNRGVVLLHGHFGNPHIIMPAIGYHGYTLSQLGSRNPPAERPGLLGNVYNVLRMHIYKSKLRYKESLPVSFIYTDTFIRDIYRRLAANVIIAMGIDGREGNKSIELDFLGGRALFYTGTMKMILRMNPVVLPAFHVRNKMNVHTIVIERPLELVRTGNEEEDIARNMKTFFTLFEKYVYQYPDHYAKVFCLGQGFFVSSGRE